MNKVINENCKDGKKIINFYLKQQVKKIEIENHFENCAECREVSGEDARLKFLLKRAVEREFAPQSLVDSIRNGIRR
ncbi:MAG TPA: hypothetical protein VF556_12760 [Pyrinomonadaceae bacterium]|jgi:predicted anti-sigma-YlaC factor YlaD